MKSKNKIGITVLTTAMLLSPTLQVPQHLAPGEAVNSTVEAATKLSAADQKLLTSLKVEAKNLNKEILAQGSATEKANKAVLDDLVKQNKSLSQKMTSSQKSQLATVMKDLEATQKSVQAAQKEAKSTYSLSLKKTTPKEMQPLVETMKKKKTAILDIEKLSKTQRADAKEELQGIKEDIAKSDKPVAEKNAKEALKKSKSEAKTLYKLQQDKADDILDKNDDVLDEIEDYLDDYEAAITKEQQTLLNNYAQQLTALEPSVKDLEQRSKDQYKLTTKAKTAEGVNTVINRIERFTPQLDDLEAQSKTIRENALAVGTTLKNAEGSLKQLIEQAKSLYDSEKDRVDNIVDLNEDVVKDTEKYIKDNKYKMTDSEITQLSNLAAQLEALEPSVKQLKNKLDAQYKVYTKNKTTSGVATFMSELQSFTSELNTLEVQFETIRTSIASSIAVK